MWKFHPKGGGGGHPITKHTGILALTGMIAGTFPWSGGGSGIVWSLVFHAEL